MDKRTSKSPSATPTLNPVTRVIAEGPEPDPGGAGIDRKSKKALMGLADAIAGAGVALSYLRNMAKSWAYRFALWNRRSPRNATVTVVCVAAALATMYVLVYNGHHGKVQHPSKADDEVVATGSDVRKHTVKQGEHLALIGKMYGISRMEMVTANPGINPDKLAIGQVVNVPATTVANNGN